MRPTRSFASYALPDGLASHQLQALAWLRERPVALIADPTGSGKTAVAAAAVAYAFDVEGARRAVWVTEAHLIPQAVRELHRFLPTVQVSPWPGRNGDHIKVLSVETLTGHVDRVLEFGADVGVVDDAPIKGEGPEPAAVSRVLSGAFRRLGLNATPVELDATEAYRILRVLGAPDLPPKSVFASYMQWEALPYGQERPYATRPDAVALVRGVFARYVLCRAPHELELVLPQLQEDRVWVRLTPPQQAAYQRAGAEKSPLASAGKREKACAFTWGRSAKAEAAVRMLVTDPSLNKVVIFAENLHHLSITERLLDAAGISWRRIDGPCSRKQRAGRSRRSGTTRRFGFCSGPEFLSEAWTDCSTAQCCSRSAPASIPHERLSASVGSGAQGRHTPQSGTSPSPATPITSARSTRRCSAANSKPQPYFTG